MLSLPDYIRGALAGMCLAFMANIAALITMILWILQKGAKQTLKMLKIGTMVILGIAGIFLTGNL